MTNPRARLQSLYDDFTLDDRASPPEPFDLPPPLGARLTVEELDEFARARPGNGETPPNAPVCFKNASAFCAEYVPLSYTIEPIARAGSLYTLTGKTGSGKTALLTATTLAVAAGRSDILNLEVTQGRVAYCTFENPDDVRMRFAVAAFTFNIDPDVLRERIWVLDRRAKPEAVCAELNRLAAMEPFTLIIVDTLAAFYDGDNINDNVQAGAFMRRLRPMTQIEGKPPVIVAAHPVKNASEDALLPYGGGAILNEVDGNLSLWKKTDTAQSILHWQGKLRGLEFQPVFFRFEELGCPDILDAKGREVRLPILRPSDDEAARQREEAEAGSDIALLRAMIETPGAAQRDYELATGINKSSIARKLKRLAREKLVENIVGKWFVTPKGKKAAETGKSE